MDSNHPALQGIALRLRGLRDALGLTVEEMAEKAGVRPEEIQTYESGEEEVPASFLFYVGQAFQVDLSVLMFGAEAHLNTGSLVRSGKGMAVTRRKDYDYKSLAYRFIGRKMEPFIVTVPYKEEMDLRFNEHPGQEFIYMLKGRLELSLGSKKYILEPGDSMYFNSTLPHALRGLDGNSAEFLDVIS
ncbi:MAG: DNA-binding protein [Desulfobacterales bacterium]|nr:MAG: DNA-binding protein [Desulfobacterales bacterium]